MKEAVRRPVEDALQKVQNLKKMTNIINDAISAIVGDAASDVDALVTAMPDPPVLDLSYMVSILTCPLLPFAVAADLSILSQLDPRELAKMVQAQMKGYIKTLNRNYQGALKELDSWPVIKLTQNFYRDFKRLGFDAVLMVEVQAVTAAIKIICPDEYAEGPYEAFDGAVQGFSLTGFLPSGLDSEVNDLMTALQGGEIKIEAWRAAASAPIVF
jgi:hypothetical protein